MGVGTDSTRCLEHCLIARQSKESAHVKASFVNSAVRSFLTISKQLLHAERTKKITSFAPEAPDSIMSLEMKGVRATKGLKWMVLDPLPLVGDRFLNSSIYPTFHEFFFIGNLISKMSLNKSTFN